MIRQPALERAIVEIVAVGGEFSGLDSMKEACYRNDVVPEALYGAVLPFAENCFRPAGAGHKAGPLRDIGLSARQREEVKQQLVAIAIAAGLVGIRARAQVTE